LVLKYDATPDARPPGFPAKGILSLALVCIVVNILRRAVRVQQEGIEAVVDVLPVRLVQRGHIARLRIDLPRELKLGSFEPVALLRCGGQGAGSRGQVRSVRAGRWRSNIVDDYSTAARTSPAADRSAVRFSPPGTAPPNSGEKWLSFS